MIDKELNLQIYKHLNIKNNPIKKKWVEDLNRHFYKEDYRWLKST